jgi:hypothetical protein
LSAYSAYQALIESDFESTFTGFPVCHDLAVDPKSLPHDLEILKQCWWI